MSVVLYKARESLWGCAVGDSFENGAILDGDGEGRGEGIPADFLFPPTQMERH